MRPDSSLTVALRPEVEFRRLWGIYSAREARWLDVLFKSEQEALQSLRVLQVDGRTIRRSS